MDDDIDADDAPGEPYTATGTFANLHHTSLDDHLGHLMNRGVTVLAPNHVPIHQQQHAISHEMIAANANNLAKGKKQPTSKHILQQRPLQQLPLEQQQQQQRDQQQVQQQRVQQQVQFQTLQSEHDKANNVKGKSAKNASTNNSSTIKRRKPNDSSNESSSETCINNSSSSRTNQFALLSELDITYTSNASIAEITSTTNSGTPARNTNSNILPGNSPKNNPAGNGNQNLNQTKFCPPIILYNIDIGKLALDFKNKFPNIELKIVNCSRFRSKLYIKGIQAYNAVMAILKEKKISSHSFTPIENKQTSLIIRGLHCNTSIDEIKNELDTVVPNVISDVRSFETPFMKKNNISSDLFSVTLFPGKSFNEIVNIKYLLLQRIHWEKPKSSSKEVQCKRCQRWGHLAKNCNHSFQCVKCDKSHEPGQCALVKEDNSKPYCVNCRKWGHPANFRGCEAHLALLEQRKLKQNSTLPTRRTVHSNSFVTPRKSFASLFKPKNTNASSDYPKSRSSQLINEFLLVAKQLLDSEPISIESRIENFLKNFKSLSAEDRKSECREILHDLQNHDG